MSRGKARRRVLDFHKRMCNGRLICRWCSKELCDETVTLDHLTPKWLVGDINLRLNSAPACFSCNQERSSLQRDMFKLRSLQSCIRLFRAGIIPVANSLIKCERKLLARIGSSFVELMV